MEREKPTQDDPEQSKRFIEAARKAEADESEKNADKAFKRTLRSASSKRRDQASK